MGARQRSQPPSPEGLFVCLWRESLPHSLLVSRVFRGIKPSPMENTKAPRRIKRKSPTRPTRGATWTFLVDQQGKREKQLITVFRSARQKTRSRASRENDTKSYDYVFRSRRRTLDRPVILLVSSPPLSAVLRTLQIGDLRSRSKSVTPTTLGYQRTRSSRLNASIQTHLCLIM